MILKIGKGTFNVRLTVALLAAWGRWKLWPSYENLQRLSREIGAREIRKVQRISAHATKDPLPRVTLVRKNKP